MECDFLAVGNSMSSMPDRSIAAEGENASPNASFEDSLRRSAELVAGLAKRLTDFVDQVEASREDRVTELLAAIAFYARRQVEAICFLVSRPQYVEQADQLVRGLAETWAVAAWLVKPITSEGRYERWLRLHKDQNHQERKKVNRRQQEGLSTHPEDIRLLSEQERFVEQEEMRLGKTMKLMPDSRELYGERSDFYNVFAFASDPAHASVGSIASTVSQKGYGSFPHIGGPSPAWKRAQTMLLTRPLLEAVGEAMVSGLEIDRALWENPMRHVLETTEALLQPIVRSG